MMAGCLDATILWMMYGWRGQSSGSLDLRWKVALNLPLDYGGFDASSMSVISGTPGEVSARALRLLIGCWRGAREEVFGDK